MKISTALDEIFKKLFEAGKKLEEIKREEMIRELSIRINGELFQQY